MTKHIITWFGKGETGDFEGEKELLNISSEELERLKLFDATYSSYPVKTLEQFSYLAQFVNFKFWTDEYDYFVEHLEGGVQEDWSSKYEASLEPKLYGLVIKSLKKTKNNEGINIMFDQEKYLTLLSTIIPKPIESEEQYDYYIELVKPFFPGDDCSLEETAIYSILCLLIEQYEDKHYSLTEYFLT